MMMRGLGLLDISLPFLRGINPNLIALYPMNDLSGAALDYSPLANTGTQDSDNVLGGGDFFGIPCVQMNGNGGINFAAASFLSAFNIEHWTIMTFFRMLTTTPWTDGVEQDFMMVNDVSITQRAHLYQTGGARTLGFIGDVGANLEIVTHQLPNESLAWHMSAATMSKDDDEFKAFVDGAQVGATQTGIGTNSGAINRATFGNRLSGAAFHTGLLAFGAVWSAPDNSGVLSASDLLSISDLMNPAVVFVGGGDSKWNVQTSLQVALMNAVEATNYHPVRALTDLAHGGLTAATWRNGTTGWNGIDTELAANNPAKPPAFVFVNIGTNEVPSLPVEATWKADFAYSLDAIHTKWPNARVMVELVWRETYDTQCDTLATWTQDVLSTRSWATAPIDERVYFAPNEATYSSDGAHLDLAPGIAARAAQLQAAMGY